MVFPSGHGELAGCPVGTLLIGVVLLETGMIDNPAHALIGERTLRRVAGSVE